MKLAVLDDETVVPYDHLLLCTGNQFPIIAPMQATVMNPLSKKPVPPKPDRILFGMFFSMEDFPFLSKSYLAYIYFNVDPPPPNVLTINDEFDAAMVFKWLHMTHHTERK